MRRRRRALGERVESTHGCLKLLALASVSQSAQRPMPGSIQLCNRSAPRRGGVPKGGPGDSADRDIEISISIDRSKRSPLNSSLTPACCLPHQIISHTRQCSTPWTKRLRQSTLAAATPLWGQHRRQQQHQVRVCVGVIRFVGLLSRSPRSDRVRSRLPAHSIEVGECACPSSRHQPIVFTALELSTPPCHYPARSICPCC